MLRGQYTLALLENAVDFQTDRLYEILFEEEKRHSFQFYF